MFACVQTVCMCVREGERVGGTEYVLSIHNKKNLLNGFGYFAVVSPLK